MDLSKYVVAVLGGDGREVECVRQLLAEGASVRTCGLPKGSKNPIGASVHGTVKEALEGGSYNHLPCPSPTPGRRNICSSLRNQVIRGMPRTWPAWYLGGS